MKFKKIILYDLQSKPLEKEFVEKLKELAESLEIIFAEGEYLKRLKLSDLENADALITRLFDYYDDSLFLKSNLKYVKYFQNVDIVAGDYLAISQYMPQDMEGKIIITNTVTSSNVEDLKKRGVSYLITTTPELNGRSFGTNVFQATLLAISGKSPQELNPEDYLKLIEKIGFKPRIEKLN